MVNRVILIGNLGKDPEVRRLENGAVVAKFPIATNENYKDKSGEWQSITEWHDIVVWRSLAERAENSLTKGAQVYVEGKLTHRTWQDKDGNNRRTTEVAANYFRLINSKRGNSGGSSGYFPSADDEVSAPNRPAATEQPASTTETAENSSTADDDLPF
jgi:single-strand DNA-binding protein